MSHLNAPKFDARYILGRTTRVVNTSQRVNEVRKLRRFARDLFGYSCMQTVIEKLPVASVQLPCRTLFVRN